MKLDLTECVKRLLGHVGSNHFSIHNQICKREITMRVNEITFA